VRYCYVVGIFAPVQNAANIAPDQPADYKALYENLLAAYEQLQVELLQLKKLIFGSTHERFEPQNPEGPQQGTLFNVAPVAEVVTETITIPEREIAKTTIVSKHKGRESFPEKLRRESVVIEPIGIDTQAAQKIGEDVTELLAYTPSELYVKQIRRPRYAMSHTGSVIQAPAPARAIEKCSADTSLLAQVAVEKYIDHLPLYRQIKRYERLGITISDSTMGDWVRQTAHALTGIYNRHKELVLASHYLHADETIIKVLTDEKKGATHQGYYWVYQSHHDKLVLFDYRPGRDRDGPETILKDFKGYLQTDGYSGYNIFNDYPDITLFYCLAHARRKFHESLQNDRKRAEYALAQFQQLYTIERDAREMGIKGDALTQYRQEHAAPILKELGAWMQKAYAEVLPRSTIGNALEYSLKRWGALSLYATNGLLNIDNNPVENSIRPVALGRKNYLFAGSHSAAERAATFYSLFATCKAHGANPYDWLKDVLDKLAYWKLSKIDDLLPQNWVKQNR
jgi:transposase